MRTVRNRWIDIVGALGLVVAAAVMMYALLPQQTQPGQQVVPPLPASASDPTVAFLTIFIVMTMVGAPITLAIVLALIVRWVSKQVPASSAAAEAAASKSAAKVAAKPSSASNSPQPLSAKDTIVWRIAATGLSLIMIGGLLALFWNNIVRLFNP